MRTMMNTTKIIYTDICIVMSTGALLLTGLEFTQPGLISSLVDISSLWIIAIAMGSIGVWRGWFVDALDRWQIRYINASLVVSCGICCMVISLQLGAHLLGLAVVAASMLVVLANSILSYDSRRHR